MPADLSDKLVIGISSRALFDLDESHQIFENDGLAAYQAYQIKHEQVPLNPGPAFKLVRKLLSLAAPDTQERLVEVILLSRNSTDTGLRIFNSITEHKLPITRAAFTNGRSPYQYVTAFHTSLFLSAHADDVRQALAERCAAATIIEPGVDSATHQELRIAFDGDAVLFSDEAEQVFQQQGLAAFKASEAALAGRPLTPGPFKGFLSALHHIQKRFPPDACPIRTALVTARDAPAHERVITTLRSWGVRTDEALFLGGLSKGDFLKAFGADIFFDDQQTHCDSAQPFVTAGHVPHGVTNQAKVTS